MIAVNPQIDVRFFAHDIDAVANNRSFCRVRSDWSWGVGAFYSGLGAYG
jgi:hypothetical protein